MPVPGPHRSQVRIWKTFIAFTKFSGLVLLYVLTGIGSRTVDFVQEDVRVLLPQAGVALAGLAILGLRYWLAVTAGSVLVTVSAGLDFRIAVIFATSNTIAAVAGAGLLKLWGFERGFSRIRDVYGLLAGGVLLAPFLGGTLAVVLYHLVLQPLPIDLQVTLWLRRWLGLSISNLAVAPVLLTWSANVFRPRTAARLGEAAMLIASALTVCLYTFVDPDPYSLEKFPLSFVPFPFATWAALRFGPRGAATATLLVAIAATYGTSRGIGPFVMTDQSISLLMLQLYIMALALSSLFLAAAMAERISAERELNQSRELLRALSARIEQARENERARISREVHDELGQQLTGIKMALHGLAKNLPEGSVRAADRCSQAMQIADEAIQSIRRIATDLRPGILDDLGIVPSLHWLVEDFTRRTGIEGRFTSACSSLEVGRSISTALFRVAQEALTNVTRHAEAQAVTVSLTDDDGELVLRIEDDGRGLTPGLNDTGRNSLGIVGMRERAELLGGTLSVHSLGSARSRSERTGTVVEMRIPFRAPAQKA